MRSLFSLSRVTRKSTTAAAALLLLLSSATPGFAQTAKTDYLDVQAGVWYEDAAEALLEMGALDERESRLRPNDLATRAELVKLLVRVQDLDLISPSVPSFNDVPKSAWYYEYFETAAEEGWVRGDSNCYQNTRPCKARPADNVNRAEAAALLQRAFDLDHTEDAPRFPDVQAGVWYFVPVQTAADHCILQGDDGTGRVRPSARMNRAEMIVMFHRASEDLEYARDCGPDVSITPNLVTAEATATTKIRLTFNVDLDEAEAEDEGNYRVRLDNGNTASGDIVVTDAQLTSDKVVALTVDEALGSKRRYIVTVSNMHTADDDTFNDSATFVSQEVAVTPNIVSLTVPASNRIVLTFNTDLDNTRAEEKFRYRVAHVNGDVTVDQAVQLSDKSVELRLGTGLTLQGAYNITASGLHTMDDEIFTDTHAFVYNNNPVTFRATLNGAQEVPAVTTTATGSATFTLTENGLAYDITLHSMTGAITGAHFHLGAAGVSGDVMEPISFTAKRAQGTWTSLTEAERDAILDGRVYVNVHTAAHPNGEIRGQVVRN